MSNYVECKIPFLEDKFKELYENDDFAIASGEDKDYQGHISVGVRWKRSRGEPDNNKFVGFPTTRGHRGCWLILPDDIALCLLSFVLGKDKNKDKDIAETIQALMQKIQEKDTK